MRAVAASSEVVEMAVVWRETGTPEEERRAAKEASDTAVEVAP